MSLTLKMKRAVRWGLFGASLGIMLCELQSTFPHSAMIWSTFRTLNYPVILAWNASGRLDDDALQWTTWIHVTELLYCAIVGFVAGLIALWFFAHRSTASR